MTGKPEDFEAIGSRLGFHAVEDSGERLLLAWHGPRFPAFLCLGIASLLVFVSIPIAHAIYLNGFSSRAMSLWYFPLMNIVLLGISAYLLTQRRQIVIDGRSRTITLRKRSFHKALSLTLDEAEIEGIHLTMDQVYSGFALAGSSAAQSFPVPSLRLVTSKGDSVLLDRGSKRRLAELGDKIAQRLGMPLIVEPTTTPRPG